jgi:penicillin amidase
MNRSPRILLISVSGAALVALVALAAAAGWFYFAARSALPQLDGTISVEGITAPVTVTRDAFGIPHIKAETLDDLFFAQGFVTAQDRLWQMDMMRRSASGELAEVLGEDLVARDRQQRILGLRHAARQAFRSLPEPDRGYVEDYARGVNAYIQACTNRLPVEFRLLGYRPSPWAGEDSLVLAALMCQMLNHYTFPTELAREAILAKLGPALTGELYPESSGRDLVPEIHVAPAPARNAGPAASPRGHPRTTPWKHEEPVPGSNNWALAGALTVTGKALLSNDMHLGHQMPNLWYEAHLQSGSFNAAGVTLPGAPFVIVGHNGRIAWGFTNLGPDVEDIYIETFNERGEYKTSSGWKQPTRRRELIRVKGRPDQELEVLETRHGPIVTELVEHETRLLSLKWVLYDPAALAIPFFQINAARNWDEFRRALSGFGAPGQNVVYADVDGHVGYQATGLIPIRVSGDGTVPVSGEDEAHEWAGYVPFEELPSVLDPPSGIVATANGRITPEGYPHLLATQWGSPERTERIASALMSGKKFSAADMLALQMDVYSAHHRLFARLFADAVVKTERSSRRAREAAILMQKWDGMLTADAAAPTVTAIALRILRRHLLQPKLGPDWERYRWFMSSIWLENTVRHQAPHWLPPGFTGWTQLLVAAVEEAVKDDSAPPRLAGWRWGTRFPVVIEHPVFRSIPLLGSWAAPGTREQSGGGTTVKQVGRDFGPSQRMTVDFSNLDRSTLNLVTGQSGHLLSPHYMDQWAAWYEGTTFPLPFSNEAVERSRTHRLVLVGK